MPWSYRANTETITVTTAQTVVFADNTLPQGGVSKFTILTTGANNVLDNAIIGVRVKLEGVPILDITGPQLRSLQEAYHLSSSTPAAGVLRWTIPLGLPYSMGQTWPMPAGVSGIPFGMKTSVELVTNASTTAGVASIGWMTLLQQPSYMFKVVQQQTGLGASGTNGRININYGNNDVVGFTFANGANVLSRVRIVSVINGNEFQVFHASNGLALESQRTGNPLSITDPLTIQLDGAYKFPSGSYIEMDTGAGAAVSDVFCAHQVVDVRPPQK